MRGLTKVAKIAKKGQLGDIYRDEFAELTTLGEEMREAYDNTPESLQSSGVGEARGAAADTLEGLTEDEVPEAISTLEVDYPFDTKKKPSRSDRRDNAVAALSAIVDRLQEDEKVSETHADFLQGLEELISEAEGVEFPGMYG